MSTSWGFTLGALDAPLILSGDWLFIIIIIVDAVFVSATLPWRSHLNRKMQIEYHQVQRNIMFFVSYPLNWEWDNNEKTGDSLIVDCSATKEMTKKDDISFEWQTAAFRFRSRYLLMNLGVFLYGSILAFEQLPYMRLEIVEFAEFVWLLHLLDSL